MKKLIVLFAVVVMASTALMSQVMVWKNGEIVGQYSVNDVDSITFRKAEASELEGALDGRFSISANKQVCFSKGNLQYQSTTKIWRFAENQYDMIGKDNANISETYAGWIDLFSWGASGYEGIEPDSLAKYAFFEQFEDITNTNYDWGRYCAVSNGGNRAGLWRTLTRDEWNYILVLRKNADKLRARATVNGVAGYVILPDVFAERFEKDGLIDFTTEGDGYEINVYTAEEWAAFEADGAVFFPAAGCRNHEMVFNVGSFGYVWATNYNGEESAYCVLFSAYDAEVYYSVRENGLSVRLVRDFE